MIIKLENLVLDERARDGTWCKLPYPNHPKGCPNFPQCPSDRTPFRKFIDDYDWYAFIETFDLKSHVERMRKDHPSWTNRQLGNLLYWQNRVKAKLLKKTRNFMKPGDILIEAPEAHGMDVFETMRKAGIVLERNPQESVKKIMLVGEIKGGRRSHLNLEVMER